MEKEIRAKLEKAIDIEKEDNEIVFTYKDDPYRGNFDSIKDRIWIKKSSYQNVRQHDGQILNQVIMLKFNTKFIDKDFIEKIYEHHINLVAKQKQSDLANALQETFNYFANDLIKEEKNKILGDIGEAIFILKTFEFTRTNVINKIHNTDQGLYDFSFKNEKYIEIKTTPIDKNEIILSNCQVDYVNNRDFVVVKFKEIENASTIVDIYDLIKQKIGPIAGTTLEENYLKYQSYEFLNQVTINLDKVEIWKLADHCIPIVKIENISALKKAKFYLDVTDGLEPFENYIKAQDLS